MIDDFIFKALFRSFYMHWISKLVSKQLLENNHWTFLSNLYQSCWKQFKRAPPALPWLTFPVSYNSGTQIVSNVCTVSRDQRLINFLLSSNSCCHRLAGLLLFQRILKILLPVDGSSIKMYLLNRSMSQNNRNMFTYMLEWSTRKIYSISLSSWTWNT